MQEKPKLTPYDQGLMGYPLIYAEGTEERKQYVKGWLKAWIAANIGVPRAAKN